MKTCAHSRSLGQCASQKVTFVSVAREVAGGLRHSSSLAGLPTSSTNLTPDRVCVPCQSTCLPCPTTILQECSMDDLLKSLLFDAVVKRRPIAFDAEKGEFTVGLSTFPADTIINIKSIDAMVRDPSIPPPSCTVIGCNAQISHARTTNRSVREAIDAAAVFRPRVADQVITVGQASKQLGTGYLFPLTSHFFYPSWLRT